MDTGSVGIGQVLPLTVSSTNIGSGSDRVQAKAITRPVLTDADKLLKLLAQLLDVRTTEVCSVVLTTPALLEF